MAKTMLKSDATMLLLVEKDKHAKTLDAVIAAQNALYALANTLSGQPAIDAMAIHSALGDAYYDATAD